MRIRRPIFEARPHAGSALLSGLLVVMTLAVLSAAFLARTIDKHRRTQASADTKRSFYVAEAGLAESLLGLVQGKSGNVASDVRPAAFGGGVFWVTTEDAGEGRIGLKSTGLCGRGRTALSIVVEKVPQSVSSLGLFGGQAMTVESGCTIDSYDSREGIYDPQAPSDGARVGCNDDIALDGTQEEPTVIRGDATPGPESVVLKQSGVTVTGSTAPREETVPLPAIEPPDYPRENTVVHSNAKTPVVLSSGEYGLHALRIEGRTQATLYGPATVVVDELWVAEGASLALDGTAGAVKLYVLDCLSLPAGSKLATGSQAPGTVALLVSAGETADRNGDGIPDPPITLAPSGRFHGTIYVPNADVTLPQSLEVFGAVTARRLTVASRAKLHFDLALVAPEAQEAAFPQMLGWRIVDLPRVPLVERLVDPLVQLEALGIKPVPAKDAHYDIGVLPPRNDPDVATFTAGLPGLVAPAAAAAAAPLDPVSITLVARVTEQPPVGSSQLKGELLAAGPLKPDVLLAAVTRIPQLNSSDLRDVLVANAPLSDKLVREVLNTATPMNSSHLRDVLVASSPLSLNALAMVLAAGPTRISPSDLTAVLNAQ